MGNDKVSHYRREVLKKIDLEQIDSIKNDRKKLIDEVDGLIKLIASESDSINYISAIERGSLCNLIVDEIVGYGPLRELMEDDDISDILVNGPDRIFVEKNGKLKLTNKKFISNDQLTDIARRLVAKTGRRIDTSQPLVDARMPDGSRLNVVIPPISIDGTSMSIRKFGKGEIHLADLVRFNSMSEMMANFLVIASRCRVNIIVSGGTGSGKTTLLNALSQYIGEHERVLTLEDAAELRLQLEHVLRLETRLAGSENNGTVTMRELVINSLRMRPDRLIIGECRGAEAFELLQAMNTGHDGSMSTLHANNPRDALARLESMVMMANASLPLFAIRRNISSAVNLVIQASRLPDGSRKITSISEVMGMEGDNIVVQNIFSFVPKNERGGDGKIQGDFECHGLLHRSSVYQQAMNHGLAESLKKIFLNRN